VPAWAAAVHLAALRAGKAGLRLAARHLERLEKTHCLPCSSPLAAVGPFAAAPSFWPRLGWLALRPRQPGDQSWCWRSIGRWSFSRQDGSLELGWPGLPPKARPASPRLVLDPAVEALTPQRSAMAGNSKWSRSNVRRQSSDANGASCSPGSPAIMVAPERRDRAGTFSCAPH